MLLPDVNVFVYAQREDLPSHIRAKAWLEAALNGDEPVGLFAPTLASFLRITTNRRIFKIPTPLPVALLFVEATLAALAMEYGCELISSDEGFARFPDLKWRKPF